MMGRTGLFGAICFLAACGTPELRAERDQCTSQLFAKIEPRLEREVFLQTFSRQVPTGRIICKRVGDKKVCDKVTRTKYFTQPVVRTIDLNKPRRDAAIRQCTRTTCVAKFGNAECKPAGA